MRAPDMPWLFFVLRHFESEASHRQNKVPRPCSRRRLRFEGLPVPNRALRQARRRAGRWYCKPVSSVVCNGEYELSGTDKLAIIPRKSTILIRRRHSWVMPGRPRARDLDMSGFGRANTLNRTMAKEGTYSMMTLMRILPPTAGGGYTNAALSV